MGQEEDGKREQWSWLLEAHRNTDIADSHPRVKIDCIGLSSQPFYHERRLEYEPRCLAIRPDGNEVAVGTKSGTVHIVRRSGDGTWSGHKLVPRQWEQTGNVTGRDGRNAIRAACYLPPRGESPRVLVVGWYSGNMTLLWDGSGAEPYTEQMVVLPDVPHSTEPDRWVYKPRSLFPLPNGVLWKGKELLAVSTTEGPHVHLLTRCEGVYESTLTLPKNWLTREPVFNERIVGAVEHDGRFWILDAAGHLACFEVCEGSLKQITLQPPTPTVTGSPSTAPWPTRVDRKCITLMHPHARGRYRKLHSWEHGLVVLVGNDIAFVDTAEQPPDALPGEAPTASATLAPPPLPQLDSTNSLTGRPPPVVTVRSWVRAQEVFDLAVFRPYRGQIPRVALATRAPGLSWISPGQEDRAETSTRRKPGLDDASVLFVRIWPGVVDGEAPFAVWANRDHRLRIASILDRDQLACALDAQYRVGDDPERMNELVHRATTLRTPDLPWWILKRRLETGSRKEFIPEQSEAFRKSRDELVGLLEAEDLRELSRTLVREWTSAARSTTLPSLDSRRVIHDWTLSLLRRAWQVGRDVARDIARLIALRLAQHERSAPDDVSQILFVSFLQKWVEFGYTYGAKRLNLYALYELNRSCRRHIDALVYLARLGQQRYDVVWSLAAPIQRDAAGTWDVARSFEGDFFVQSTTDGALIAANERGEPLRWVCNSELEVRLKELGLVIEADDGRRLARNNAEEYKDFYRSSPYARRVLLDRISMGGGNSPLNRPLLIFATKGWRSIDIGTDASRRPTLYALALDFRKSDGEDSPSTLTIVDIANLPLGEEAFGLCLLPAKEHAGARVLIVGTSGAGSDTEDAAPRSRSPDPEEHRPFHEYTIARGSNQRLVIKRMEGVKIKHAGAGLRRAHLNATLPEVQHNPCWALLAVESPGTGSSATHSVTLWAGFQNGHIRRFSGAVPQSTDPPTIHPPAEWKEDDEHGEFKAASAVWRLHQISLDEPKRHLFAYGTADGTLGVLARSSQGSSAWTHVVHDREREPICGFVDYQDEGRRYLLSLSQGGMASTFDLSWDGRDRFRPDIFGSRVDRFQIGTSVRAVVAARDESLKVSSTNAERLAPAIVVGALDGQLHKLSITLPRPSKRRKDAMHLPAGRSPEPSLPFLFNEILKEPHLGYPFNDLGQLSRWLRVLDVSDVSLVRFSLWHELRSAGDNVIDALERPEKLGVLVVGYVSSLKALALEAYGLKPFSTDPAKVMWEEGARVANRIADLALRSRDRREELVKHYKHLCGTIDDLCNRCLGLGKTLESSVLMHVFKSVVAWPTILLIALPAERDTQLALTREMLLRNIFQRRLLCSDTLVQTEALRVVNDATFRAIVKLRAIGEINLCLTSPSVPGFLDLLTMVTDLGERNAEALSATNPLATQIARFLALSILLIPSSALFVGQVASECRLIERIRDIPESIASMASDIQRELKERYRCNLGPEVEVGLERLQQYLRPDKGIDTLRKDAEAARTAQHKEPIPEEQLFLQELCDVYLAVAELAPLRESSQGPAWLREEAPANPKYFRHSHAALRTLFQMRKELIGEVESKRVNGAMTRCTEAEDYLLTTRDLFEPLRTYYVKQIAQSWRGQLNQINQRAVSILDTIENFNRHVYRTSADDLLAAASELVYQHHPMSPLNTEASTLHVRSQLPNHGIVQHVFRVGRDLVENTHLVSLMLMVARGQLSDRLPVTYEMTLDMVKAELYLAARDFGLAFKEHHLRSKNVGRLPGSHILWHVILHELFHNLYKYGTAAQSGSAPVFAWLGEIPATPATPARFVLRIGGSRAFQDGLSEQYKAQLRSMEDGEFRSATLRGWAQSIGVGRDRFHDPPSAGGAPSNGFGMQFMKSICDYSGILIECDLDDTWWLEFEQTEMENRPLCYSLSWQVPSESP